MTDKEDLMLVDLRMMEAKPIKIDVRRDEARVQRWQQALGWGWINISKEVDGMIMGAITDTGRAHLALQPVPARVPEPIEGVISPWMPITDPIHLAVIGKLGEECCELGARLFRTVIQGLDEKDPDSKRTNREEISREIADVIAGLQTIKRELDIDYDDSRVNGKRNGFSRWFRKIRHILAGGDGSIE